MWYRRHYSFGFVARRGVNPGFLGYGVVCQVDGVSLTVHHKISRTLEADRVLSTGRPAQIRWPKSASHFPHLSINRHNWTFLVHHFPPKSNRFSSFLEEAVGLEEALRRRLQGPGLNRWVLPDPWHLILSIPGIHGSGSRCRVVGLKTSSMT